jgi:cytochrome P450
MVCLQLPKLKSTNRKLERALAAVQAKGKEENILTAINNQDHSRMKRVLANAFSNRALTDQEPYIQHYVSIFIDSLHSVHQTEPVNIVAWLEFLTCDIIGMITASSTDPLSAKL